MKKCADDNAQADDFRRPGHVFPLRAREGGVLRRTGHTEATVDLCKLAGLKPVGICCEIMSEDGNMARTPELKEFAKEHWVGFYYRCCFGRLTARCTKNGASCG